MALLGRNGAGKSTTLKAIAGLAPPRRGQVMVMGRDMANRKPHLIAQAGVGFVPEDRQVFPEHSAEDNLEIAAKKGPAGQDYWNLTRSTRSFRCSSRCVNGKPAGFPAASSRCWRSPAR